MKRILIQDIYNSKKTWEVSYISHGIYLKQFICGKQFNRGSRVSKRWIKDIGLFEMPVISVSDF
jgi:hypothetical protein